MFYVHSWGHFWAIVSDNLMYGPQWKTKLLTGAKEKEMWNEFPDSGVEQAVGQGGRMPLQISMQGERIGLCPSTFQWLHSLRSDWNSEKLTNLSAGQHSAYRYCRPSFQTHYAWSQHAWPQLEGKKACAPISGGANWNSGGQLQNFSGARNFSPSQFFIACSTPAISDPSVVTIWANPIPFPRHRH